MAGHSKWAQIKRQKGSEDAKKSKLFAKISRAITSESKRAGSPGSPGLRAVIEKAKKENMPKDTIERAVKKGLESGSGEFYKVVYEAYGPGGVAIIIEGLTDNKNRAAQEVKHILSVNGASLATQGAASWAFKKEGDGWVPQNTTQLSHGDEVKLSEIVEKLEDLDDVQSVYTNAI